MRNFYDIMTEKIRTLGKKRRVSRLICLLLAVVLLLTVVAGDFALTYAKPQESGMDGEMNEDPVAESQYQEDPVPFDEANPADNQVENNPGLETESASENTIEIMTDGQIAFYLSVNEAWTPLSVDETNLARYFFPKDTPTEEGVVDRDGYYLAAADLEAIFTDFGFREELIRGPESAFFAYQKLNDPMIEKTRDCVKLDGSWFIPILDTDEPSGVFFMPKEDIGGMPAPAEDFALSNTFYTVQVVDDNQYVYPAGYEPSVQYVPYGGSLSVQVLNAKNVEWACVDCNEAAVEGSVTDEGTVFFLQNVTSPYTLFPSARPAEDPGVKPGDSAVQPEEPGVKPEEPAVNPEDSAEKPEDPAVNPEDGGSQDPKEEPAPVEEGGKKPETGGESDVKNSSEQSDKSDQKPGEEPAVKPEEKPKDVDMTYEGMLGQGIAYKLEIRLKPEAERKAGAPVSFADSARPVFQVTENQFPSNEAYQKYIETNYPTCDPIQGLVFRFAFADGNQEIDLTNFDVKVVFTVPAPQETRTVKPAKDAKETLFRGYQAALLSEEGGAYATLAEKESLDDPAAPIALEAKLSGSGSFVLGLRSAANPQFTVEYYADLPLSRNRVPSQTSGNVIVTAKGDLPENRGDGINPTDSGLLQMPFREVSTGGGTVYYFDTVIERTKIYKEETFRYFNAPNLTYFNKLRENGNYQITKILVKQPGETDFTEYPKSVKFTNGAPTGGRVQIREGTILRLLYLPTTTSDIAVPTKAYDYDISDGKLYKSDNKNGSQFGQHPEYSTKTYSYTYQSGINNPRNYRPGGACKLAFGNANTGMGYDDDHFWDDTYWTSNKLNKFNPFGFKGCTFGLVTGLDLSYDVPSEGPAWGKLRYHGYVRAPKLFNEGPAIGKTVYDSTTNEYFNLHFDREGDAYTLKSMWMGDRARGTYVPAATDLDVFRHPVWYNGAVLQNIYSNEFWPMDIAKSAGAPGSPVGHDPMFGDYQTHFDYKRSYFGNGMPRALPYSDFGVNHNSYFGFQARITFRPSKDYLGPLNYFFFGDDDLWVFLDGKKIIDIGGVHSTVGQFVDLRSYMKPEDPDYDQEHTLHIFYTERGSSGSTCFMRFTLPSVSVAMPTYHSTSLTIEKDAVGAIDKDQEFEFQLDLKDANGTSNLVSDYSGTIYDEDGTTVETLLIEGGNMPYEFKLKDGQYMVVSYLPLGTKYTVTEVVAGSPGFRTSYGINGGALTEGLVAAGDIPTTEGAHVLFRNFRPSALPQTGGIGTIGFYLGGAALLTAAGALGRRRKWKTAEKKK